MEKQLALYVTMSTNGDTLLEVEDRERGDTESSSGAEPETHRIACPSLAQRAKSKFLYGTA